MKKSNIIYLSDFWGGQHLSHWFITFLLVIKYDTCQGLYKSTYKRFSISHHQKQLGYSLIKTRSRSSLSCSTIIFACYVHWRLYFPNDFSRHLLSDPRKENGISMWFPFYQLLHSKLKNTTKNQKNQKKVGYTFHNIRIFSNVFVFS